MNEAAKPENTDAARSAALDHYEANQARHLEDLKRLTRIPSVSFDGFPREEVERSAACAKEILEASGLEHTEILRIPGAHP